MSLTEQVANTLKWKKSNEYCAKRLGMSLNQYTLLKSIVLLNKHKIEDDLEEFDRVVEFNEDLDEGTAVIKGVSSYEPKTPEEIIRILKIDTSKWRLSSYWNKEKKDGWYISAMVTAIKPGDDEFLKKVFDQIQLKYQPVADITHINNKFARDCVGVISIQDLHFGKESNENIVIHFQEAVKDLVHRAYFSHKLNKIVYVIGGDLLNMDNFDGATTSGTPVENHQKSHDAYTVAFEALFWSINYIKQFCDVLEVVYLPGNHDRLSSFHIAHALSKVFYAVNNIIFHADYAERKVITYGSNFFAFEHGDVTKKNTALVYATEFSELWGKTKYRTCYTGHFHSKKVVEYITENEQNGFSIKHLPSLCSTDYWHYHNKYTGSKRQALMEVHDAEKGKISEFVYTV